MGAFTPAERDALAKSIFTLLCTREPYAREPEPGQWVTIGGGPGPRGERHAGGTPVKISPSGQIAAGPDHLEGKHIAEVDRNREPETKRTHHPAMHALSEATGTPIDRLDAVEFTDDTILQHTGRSAAELVREGVLERGFRGYVVTRAAQKGVRGTALPGKSEPPGQEKPPAHRASSGAGGTAAGSPSGTPPAPGDLGTQRTAKLAPTPGGQQSAGKQAADPRFTLKPPSAAAPPSKPKQLSLFDKLQTDPDSPEAAALAKAHPTAAAVARGIGPHRLANDGTDTPPPGVKVTPEGIWTGMATLHVADIKADPKRFQYKVSGIGEKGVTKELADVRQYNPLYGGQLLVWRDPADGQTYVINGHHRHELASRSQPFTDPVTGLAWNGEMQAYYIPARTAEEARALGALANMAEGRGTATDAAKFLRDTGKTIEDLQASGISLRGKVAADAVHLKDLSPRAFQALAEGRIPESRALAVARDLKDPALQDQLLARLEAREQAGKPIPDSHVAEMAKEMALAGKSQSTGKSLFGDDLFAEESLIDQRAELKAFLRSALTSEANTFRAVSSARRTHKLQEGGRNVLDVEGNRQRAQQAEEATFLFDKLANTKGPLSDAIQRAAQELKDAPRRKKEIAERLRAAALGIFEREWGERPSAEAYSRPVAEADRVHQAAADRGGARARDGQPGQESFRAALAAALRPALERYAREGVIEIAGHKQDQAEANYRHGFSNARCGTCAHFRPGGRCAQVAGDIDPQAVCDLFTATRETDEHAGRGPLSDPERYQLAAEIGRKIAEHYAA